MTTKTNKNIDVDIRKLAQTIEITLDSLGVIARVVEVNKNEKDIDFNSCQVPFFSIGVFNVK